MKTRSYWKDIWQSLTQSKGRFFSIFSLMMIGATALIGLKVTGPNMNRTAQAFIQRQATMDAVVLASAGFSDVDIAELGDLAETEVELAYLVDVTIKGTDQALRLFSKPSQISRFDLISGRWPKRADEILLSERLAEQYALGEPITVSQPAGDVLQVTQLTVVGFANSSEIWDQVNLGTTTVGTGELAGYGMVLGGAFERMPYNLARLRYLDLTDLPFYEAAYRREVETRQTELKRQWVDKGGRRLKALKAQPQQQLDKAKGELKTQTDQLAALPEGPEKSAAQAQLKAAQADLASQQAQLDDLPTPTYTTYYRQNYPGSGGYMTYLTSTTAISAVGDIFPVVLYLVAALVTSTTMTRFVDEERHKAGIFKALGYTERQILTKFILYGLSASLLGTLAGILLGNGILSPMIGEIILATSVIGRSTPHFYWGWSLLAVLLALLSAVLPSYLVARRELLQSPARLLQAKPPLAGARIALERLGWLWRRLSFTQKVTARNIFRYKQRMLMTILGVAGSVALLFAGLGIQSSISGVVATQFGDIFRYELIVVENSRADQAAQSRLKQRLAGSAIAGHLAVRYEAVTDTIDGVKDEQTLSLIVTEDSAALSDFIQLRDRKTQQALSLKDSGVIISEKLAQLLAVEVGDRLVLNLEQGLVRAEIAGISELYAGHYVYMTAPLYQAVTGKAYAVNAHLVRVNQGQAVDRLAADFLDQAAVAALVQNTSLAQMLTTVADSLYAVMVILVVLSVLLGLVILYNLTHINVAERIRELSTIKVLGFHHQEVTLYIYRETLVLSTLGILLGLVAGYGLHKVLLQLISASHIMFQPKVALYVYLAPILVILFILAGLGFMVNAKLRRLDMLAALKSVE